MIQFKETTFRTQLKKGEKITIKVPFEGDKKYLHEDFSKSCSCLAKPNIREEFINLEFKASSSDPSTQYIRFYEKDGLPLKILNRRGVEIFNPKKTSHKIIIKNGYKS